MGLCTICKRQCGKNAEAVYFLGPFREPLHPTSGSDIALINISMEQNHYNPIICYFLHPLSCIHIQLSKQSKYRNRHLRDTWTLYKGPPPPSESLIFQCENLPHTCQFSLFFLPTYLNSPNPKTMTLE